MKIRIIALGRAREGPERVLFETYRARLGWQCELTELEARKGINGPELVAAEGELIQKVLGAKPATDRMVIALDERGQNLTSRDLARKITALGDQGCRELAFIIGGADGLAQAVREQAGLLLSFGSMTWPHMLVRVLLMEQVYRAQTIIAGHPYHRG